MTWLKIEDTVTEHPSFAQLSPFAWTLWLHGLTYCSRNLTDGLIPQAMLTRLSALKEPEKACAELVDAGRWHVIEGGWRVHDYLDHQRSRREVEDERAGAKERQRRSRAKRKGVTGESQRDEGVSHGDVTQQETEAESETDNNPPTPLHEGGSTPSRSQGHVLWNGDVPATQGTPEQRDTAVARLQANAGWEFEDDDEGGVPTVKARTG